MNGLTQNIKKIVYKHGFQKVGIAPAEQPEKSKLLQTWLSKKFHGDMKWMEKHADKKSNLQIFFPVAKSVICVAHNYYSPYKHSTDPKKGKISRYAWGEDYHKIIKKKLKKVLNEIKKLSPEINGRICVDTAPIMEKLWAEKAGIGWQGKHTNLITKDYGSWVFLGEILLDVELVYDPPMEDFCFSAS